MKSRRMINSNFVLSVLFIFVAGCAGLCYGSEIHDAAREGNLNRVQELAAQGADVNAEDDKGKTVLDYAQQSGNQELVQWINDQQSQNNNWIWGIGITSAVVILATGAFYICRSRLLRYAVSKNNLCLAKWLVTLGANVNEKDKAGNTALYNAAKNGNLELVKLLVKYADIDLKCEGDMTPLHTALYEEKWDVAKFLVEYGADINAKDVIDMPALVITAGKDNWEMVKWLIEHGADVNATGIHGIPTLQLVAAQKIWDMVTWLIEHGADVNIKSEVNDGRAVLHHAVLDNNWDMVKYLVEHGADVNVQDNFRGTAILYAAEAENWELVQWLAEHGADINACSDNGASVLCIPAKKGDMARIDWLMGLGASVRKQIDKGFTVLTFAAGSGNLELVKWLVKRGANLKTKGTLGGTVLHAAAESGNMAMVKWMIAQGADVKAMRDDGGTVLHSAAESGNLELVKWLIKQGLDVKAKRILFVPNVITINNVSKAKPMLFDIDWTIMHCAANSGNLELVQWLVSEYKLKVNVKSNNGHTPLHEAAGKNLELVKWLVQNGADVNAKNTYLNCSVLDVAIAHGNQEIIQWLKENGAKEGLYL